MPIKKLKNPPLVEAIFELRWALQPLPNGGQIDPHYKILVGRLYDKFHEAYPEHEPLPTASMPDEISGGTVQHRFRCAPQDWPLIQIGPGILTVNDTKYNTWEDFRTRTEDAVKKLFEAYPKSETLKIESLMLRYIDATKCNYLAQDIFSFLKSKMNISINLPKNLFEYEGIKQVPHQFNWQSSFKCDKPKGNVVIRFVTGQQHNLPALIWETIVHSHETDIPEMPVNFETWLNSAHAITDDWFFKLIDGDLKKEFNDEQ